MQAGFCKKYKRKWGKIAALLKSQSSALLFILCYLVILMEISYCPAVRNKVSFKLPLITDKILNE